MATKELSKTERLEKGQLYIRTIIEVLGKPKDFVEQAIREYVESIKKNEKIQVKKEEFADCVETEGLYSVFVELEMWMEDMSEIIKFCFDFMPSSIEIIEPENMNYPSNEFAGFLNDLQARLHEVDMIVKNLRQQNKNLKSNVSVLVKNTIAITLFEKERDIAELAKVIGIEEKELEPILSKLIEDKFIKKEGEKYKLENG